jgi:hypothetical protein
MSEKQNNSEFGRIKARRKKKLTECKNAIAANESYATRHRGTVNNNTQQFTRNDGRRADAIEGCFALVTFSINEIESICSSAC